MIIFNDGSELTILLPESLHFDSLVAILLEVFSRRVNTSVQVSIVDLLESTDFANVRTLLAHVRALEIVL